MWLFHSKHDREAATIRGVPQIPGTDQLSLCTTNSKTTDEFSIVPVRFTKSAVFFLEQSR